MATSDEILSLRMFTAEFDDTSYNDEQLAAIIDSSTSIKLAAATVWTQKAAKFAALVNVSESGSSRSLSDLHTNALRMAATMNAENTQDTTESTGIRIRKLTRK